MNSLFWVLVTIGLSYASEHQRDIQLCRSSNTDISLYRPPTQLYILPAVPMASHSNNQILHTDHNEEDTHEHDEEESYESDSDAGYDGDDDSIPDLEEITRSPPAPDLTASLPDIDEPRVIFKRLSPLQQFLHTKKVQLSFTFREILLFLKQKILEGKLYDQRNEGIVICDPELENIFDRRAFHVTQLQELIKLQIENSHAAKWKMTFKPDAFLPLRRFFGHPDMKFHLQPSFLHAIRTMPDIDVEQRAFTYSESHKLLSEYIIWRKHDILDQRDLNVAHLKEDDPLKESFKVQYFHKGQALTLLDQQLVCISLKQKVAWDIVLMIQNVHDIYSLKIPIELRRYLALMHSDTLGVIQ